MIADLEKNNSVLSADLEEAKRVIEGLQRERDDLQRYALWNRVYVRQKAKMESLYASLKKQQRQSLKNGNDVSNSAVPFLLTVRGKREV